MEFELKKRQQKLNKKYEQEGLTTETLNEQVEINRLRHQHNIQDPNEQTYKEYVQ